MLCISELWSVHTRGGGNERESRLALAQSGQMRVNRRLLMLWPDGKRAAALVARDCARVDPDNGQ